MYIRLVIRPEVIRLRRLVVGEARRFPELAKTYYCMKSDKASYESTLREVIEAPDLLPEQRLQNTIAKRRARRYLTKSRMASCGF